MADDNFSGDDADIYDYGDPKDDDQGDVGGDDSMAMTVVIGGSVW